MSQETNTGHMLSSVKNAMKILRLYKADRTELSVTEIANYVNLPKSTAHRLISEMASEGFLSKNPKTGHYRLGLSLLTLGGVIFSNRDLYTEAQPVMKKLVEQLGETAHICLLENDEVVYLFRKECKDPVRLLTDMGRKNPFYCTSEGMAILAFQDAKVIQTLMAKELYAYTPQTITDKEMLMEQLDLIREQGYSISKDQFYSGFTGIAAPIRDYTENVVSSIAVIGPSTRITEQRYPVFIHAIKEAANHISKLLGYYHNRT